MLGRLNTMSAVCNKEDCPFYNCFYNTTNYKPMKDAYNSVVKEKTFKELVINSLEVQALVLNIKTTCISCVHFEKQDGYADLIFGRAKNDLVGGKDVFSGK